MYLFSYGLHVVLYMRQCLLLITVTCMYLLQIRFSLVNDIFIPVYRYEYMHCMIIPFKVEICFHYTSNLVLSHSTLSLLSSKPADYGMYLCLEVYL